MNWQMSVHKLTQSNQLFLKSFHFTETAPLITTAARSSENHPQLQHRSTTTPSTIPVYMWSVCFNLGNNLLEVFAQTT